MPVEPSLAELPIWLAFFVAGIAVASFVIRSYSDAERPTFWASFAAHQVSAVLIVVVVRAVYGWGDLFGYHWSGTFLAARLRDDFFDMAPRLISVLFQQEEPLPFPGVSAGSNTGSMQALSGFLCLLCGDSVFAVCSLIATGSFAAKAAIYKALKTELPDGSHKALLFACMLVPSAVFWSSGLLKEPIAVIGLAAMVHGAHRIVRFNGHGSGLAWLAAGSVTTGLFKGYLIPPFGIGAAFYFTARAMFGDGKVIQTRYLFLAVVLAAGFVLATGAALPRFSAETFADEALQAQAIGQRIEGGSNYALGGETLVSQIPLAVVTVLYRPFVFEISNALVAINALEMLGAAILTAILLLRGSVVTTWRYALSRPALCFCVGFVLTLAVGIGLTTTNLGTLSRYRFPLIPFYAAVLIVLATRSPVPAAGRIGVVQNNGEPNRSPI